MRSVRSLEYARADQLTHFRYLIEFPGGAQMTVARDGQLAPFNASVGWRRGVPYSFSVPLQDPGSYLFVIETMDQQNHITREAVAYCSQELAPRAVLELSDLAPQVQGVAFDSRQRLWI